MPSRGTIHFRNEADGQEQGIAVDIEFRARNRFHMVVDFGRRNAADPIFPMDSRNRVRQIQGNIIVIEALNHVSRKTVGEGADFENGLYLAAFQSHARA